MSMYRTINTAVFSLVFALQASNVNAFDAQYQIIYNGKKVGTQSVSMEAMADGQSQYYEKTSAKFKQFFMTFNISSELTVTFDESGINTFSGYETFDGEKGSVSGQRFGPKYEVVIQEDDEPAETFVIEVDQFELSEITPPLLQYKVLSQKQAGDEVSYFDFDSGSVQGIKLTALDKRKDHISATYHYIGDKEFVDDNDEEISITINAEGKVLAFSEDDDVQFKLID